RTRFTLTGIFRVGPEPGSFQRKFMSNYTSEWGTLPFARPDMGSDNGRSWTLPRKQSISGYIFSHPSGRALSSTAIHPNKSSMNLCRRYVTYLMLVIACEFERGPNQSLQPTALWRCASMSTLITVFSTVAQPRCPSGG